ncbi:G-type lectin S-receptor-like serine/threonine-protein kinase SD2-5 [Capsicum chinense]|nr:putative G-type lectin S-receptor-like serine/threonine-protein kinase SD2-5-like [Capsicum annuum]PHU12558.1 G-type lectin S-receptor-like serine/threonine-protein kinase SD2-5 [Capsicum chinense]
MGNLVLFDKRKRVIWQSFDHPTDCLVPGQSLVSGQKLTASVSADNSSQGLLSLTILNGHLATYVASDPPQYYYASDDPDSRYYSFDGKTLTALQYPPTSTGQFIKLGHDGHLRVYQLGNLENNLFGVNWKEVDDIFTRGGDCFLLNEVFALTDSISSSTVFLKVQNSSNALVISPRQKTKPFKVIIGSTLIGIIFIFSVFSAIFKKRSQKSKAGDFSNLEPILPGILTRFSYNELKIITEDFSRQLGKGGFGSVYEGTLRNGTKIAVKHLDGLGQVKESFLTEVKTVGGIHHINLVKLIGFCAEKSHRLLIYEYMVNGSLDRWIKHEKQENGLTWNTRQRIISDVAKGLA